MSKQLLKQHAAHALKIRADQHNNARPIQSEQKTPTTLSRENASLRDQLAHLTAELHHQAALNVVPPVPPYTEGETDVPLSGDME